MFYEFDIFYILITNIKFNLKMVIILHKIFTFPLRKVFGSTTKKSLIILGQKNQTKLKLKLNHNVNAGA